MRIRSLLVALLLAAPAAPAFAQDFPVTIPHVFGETTIEAEPQRVVTWGWASQDAVLALGKIPVGIPHFAYGGDSEGALGWDRDAVAELGGDFPTILPAGNDAPIEAIAALAPDLIIAVYSGLTQDEYNILRGIAPVVAYPEVPWSTSWQEVITTTGKAIGKPVEAENLVAELQQFMADETAKYPEVEGTSFAGIAEYNGEVAVYAGLDPRMSFLEDLDMVLAPSVTELAQGESFFYSLSYETFDQLSADILISYFETPETDAAFFANPIVALHPTVQKGAVAHVIGADLINAISPPTALSIRWGFPQYIKLIAEAAKAAGK
ncbi:MAG: ABC transporter substrate-binding protein [Candidatus Devosia phytovorans]|uniref:ABC transporter substrate-binding protein n=1 Tax=Candidatus Devosia phytovorans TaxID=3121372 RepID=A0AAJ5VWY3_9HYPH|nr:ABC transporter substrate-binding protein [Devosia sp.]WEK06416.1 MAG: ABC transporter substrate-binding protein [Devosia sp.]